MCLDCIQSIILFGAKQTFCGIGIDTQMSQYFKLNNSFGRNCVQSRKLW